jgi:DNA ligase-1
MPKQQQNLDSFFGVQNKNKKQKSLTSFFKTSKDKENDNNGIKTDDEKEKEKNPASTDDDDNEDDDEDDDETQKPKSKSNNKKRDSPDEVKSKASKRRVILDDSEDDGDNDEVMEDTIDDNKSKNIKKEVKTESSSSSSSSTKPKPVVKKEDDKKTEKKEKAKVSSSSLFAETNTKPAVKKEESSSSKPVVKKEDEKKMKNEAETNKTAKADEEDDKGAVVNDKEEDTPGRRKLVRRAKKIAKAYKVDIEIEGEFLPPTKSAVKKSTKKSATSAEEDNSVVQYKDLVEVLEEIEGTSKRLEIQALMTKFFRRIIKFGTPADLNAAVYLASNTVAPAYECVELGIGDSLLIKAISEAYGSKTSSVKESVQKLGDLGLVARSCKSKQRTLGFAAKPKPLTLVRVIGAYREIAAISGSSSGKWKVDIIKKLLVGVQDSTETKFIIRGLQGKLRIGLAQSTVLVALAHALTMTIPSTVRVDDDGDDDDDDKAKANNDDDDDDDEEEDDGDDNNNEDPIVKAMMDESLPVEKTLEAHANMIRKVYSEVPSYDALLDAALKVPLVKLNEACQFQPGIPVEPMLAKPTKSIQEVLKRLNGQEFTCEYKYDGERAQIHKTPDGTLKVFSRNLLETSNKYPEVSNYVQEAAEAAIANQKEEDKEKKDGDDDDDDEFMGRPVDSYVLDAEVVAFDRVKGHLVPFQILSTRKKTQESGGSAAVQVIVQAFDLMYLNGKSLLCKSFKERRRLLHKHFAPVEGKFQFAKSLDAVEDGDTIELENFLDAAVKGQCEGLMVKTMVDIYEPSRRSLNWLKLKKDYLDGCGDSFDLVPLGAYFGRGKRTGVYGAYLLACYDEETEEFQSVCKIGTGFSDEDLKSLSASLNEHKLEGGKSSSYNVAKSLEPDVWFDSVQVWEIKAADLSKSSTHRGALGKLEEGRGIGLRFPRFERIREDKKPSQATNSDQVLEMYYNQDSVKGQGGGDDYDDDDGI